MLAALLSLLLCVLLLPSRADLSTLLCRFAVGGGLYLLLLLFLGGDSAQKGKKQKLFPF
jgi:hypothetical protein